MDESVVDVVDLTQSTCFAIYHNRYILQILPEKSRWNITSAIGQTF